MAQPESLPVVNQYLQGSAPATGEDKQCTIQRFTLEFLATKSGQAVDALTEVDWLDGQELGHPPIGYFGASTGAGAALLAAAWQYDRIGAVVSRGGRPDLAGDALSEVRAPTLLIVGGRDDVVIGLNRQAEAQLRCEHRFDIVPGATHLFEEPDALERVATLAVGWFTTHLARVPSTTRGVKR